jgi:hypothetical protein
VETEVLTRPPPLQGFVPSMGIDKFDPLERVIGCLSSYGVSNGLDGFLGSASRTRFQAPPLLTLADKPLAMPATRPSESFNVTDRPFLSKGASRTDLSHRVPLPRSKKPSILVPDPPPRAPLTRSPAGRYGSFRFFYWRRKTGRSVDPLDDRLDYQRPTRNLERLNRGCHLNRKTFSPPSP